MNSIDVTFLHPTNSTTKTAAVTADATPGFCLEKLVESGFVPPAAPGAPYTLVTADGRQLDPNTPLSAAGIHTDTTVSVVPAHQGA